MVDCCVACHCYVNLPTSVLDKYAVRMAARVKIEVGKSSFAVVCCCNYFCALFLFTMENSHDLILV